MEYNPDFKILFERSILRQLFAAYKYDFPHHELIDDVYSNVRTYQHGVDVVEFVYRDNRDYCRLASFLCRKLAIEY